MLLDIKCSVVSSIKVSLTFDDGVKKENVIAVGDLVDIEYNSNGLRKEVYGRVIKISAVGTDPNGWYITVDGSDDFHTVTARFSVMGILDFDIIKKWDTYNAISTPNDCTGIAELKIVDGYLYYTKDGIHWYEIKTEHDRENEIEGERGTVPRHHHGPKPCCEEPPHDEIYDEVNG
jgi:hypothetical protein